MSKEIDKVVSEIEKKYGGGAVRFFGEGREEQIEVISSGSLKLDWALGVGGYPRGRIIEVSGPESSGKTTMLLSATAETQKQGEAAAFIDMEHAINVPWARKCGVKIGKKDFLLAQPSSGEEALGIAEELIKSGLFGMVGIDSVPALVPKAVLEGEMDDKHIAQLARLMAQAMQKLTGAIDESRTVLYFVNQIRDKIGVQWGSPTDTPGGRALKFFSSVRMDVRIKSRIKEGKKVIGNNIVLRVTKNKVADPYREIETAIYFREGLDKYGEVLDAALEHGYIERSGNWLTFLPIGERMGQGREQARAFLKDRPQLFKKLETKMRKKLEEKLTEEFEHGETAEEN